MFETVKDFDEMDVLTLEDVLAEYMSELDALESNQTYWSFEENKEK